MRTPLLVYYSWVNDSDHTITFSAPGNERYEYEALDFSLAPGERFDIPYYENFWLGSDTPASWEWEKREDVTLSFNDGEYSVVFGYRLETIEFEDEDGTLTLIDRVYRIPVRNDFEYDPGKTSNYVDKITESSGYPEYRKVYMTYTFTNADYEAAKVYGEHQ